MTGAEMLREEGFQKGRKEGRKELLLELLTARFGELPEGVRTRVLAAEANDLKAWSLRVLSATTLEDVFAIAA